MRRRASRVYAQAMLDRTSPDRPGATPEAGPRPFQFAEPGVPVIPSVNWQGLKTLYLKEVRRFFKVQLQTIWAPAITTLLFLVIFALALGRAKTSVLGVPYTTFLAPGLIVMGMIQNAFANTMSTLLVAKVQGSIIDVLMPPLSPGELLLSWVAGAVTRGWLVGLAVWAAMAIAPGVDVQPMHPLVIFYFGTMGCVMLGLMGILTGIWADKFDHGAAVTNFVIQPLTLLSGTFYAIDRVNPTFAMLAHLNPFFYVIDGFRYGFLGVADGLLLQGTLVLLAINIVLWWAAYRVVASGWRLKA